MPESRAGIVTLKRRLQPLFANLIKQNLPHLKETVSIRLSETETQLEKVGRKPLSALEIMFKCHACLPLGEPLGEKTVSGRSYGLICRKLALPRLKYSNAASLQISPDSVRCDEQGVLYR